MRDSVDFDPRIRLDEETILLDSDESIDWSRVPTVSKPEYESFFGTDSFYSLSVTVAKPIEQQYVIDDDEYTFYKPPDELARAAWSVDNKPWTIGHPVHGHVTTVDQIKGVFDNSQYDWVDKSLDSSLNIPTNDSKSIEFLRDSDNVSIGFHNKLDANVDRDGVHAAQRDIYIDHVASVTKGRCSDKDGCKIHTVIAQ